ncbi:MAG TPA: YggS family pyridoxal phosphate-dependent enzyme [Candidatus Baltobacteraceae bacterium]
MELDLRERYARLQADLADAARAAGRSPGEITIVAVTKKQPPEVIAAALAAGITDFGENYLQEARTKFPCHPEPVEGRVRKHFIGHVQTNKAKAIVQTFDVVQSVDRIEAGRALARAARDLGKTLPILIQLNVSPAERFGCPPEQAPALAEALRAEPGLLVAGVMAIGPLTADRDALERSFALAAKTFERVGGTILSIGMSGDWREAVRWGSTMIRVGTALFGQRPAAPLIGAKN